MNRQYSLSLYTAHHAVLAKTFFWTPVFVLYFSSMVTLENVFLPEAIYYASAFITEVPSGYVSDAFGRRRTLLLAAALAAVSIRLRRVLGFKGLLLTAILLQTSLMGLLAIPGSSLIFALLMLRGIPGPLTLPAVRAEMTPLLPTGKRATFLSVQSLASRLGFAVLLTVFNRLPGEGIMPPALAGAFIGLAGILVFAALPHKRLKFKKR